MKEFKMIINGNEYAVAINNVQDDIAEVEVNGTSYSVQLDKPMQSSKKPKLTQVSRPGDATVQAPTVSVSKPKANNVQSEGGSPVKSPLPGVILEVAVNVGDIVTVGKKLIVLEAMKMENVINADKDGKVIAIKANKGDSVSEGDELVIIG